jgi:hypothetical protein
VATGQLAGSADFSEIYILVVEVFGDGFAVKTEADVLASGLVSNLVFLLLRHVEGRPDVGVISLASFILVLFLLLCQFRRGETDNFLNVFHVAGDDLVELLSRGLPHQVHVPVAPVDLVRVKSRHSISKDMLHVFDHILSYLAVLLTLLDGLVLLLTPYSDESGQITLVFRVGQGVTLQVFVL